MLGSFSKYFESTFSGVDSSPNIGEKLDTICRVFGSISLEVMRLCKLNVFIETETAANAFEDAFMLFSASFISFDACVFLLTQLESIPWIRARSMYFQNFFQSIQQKGAV